MINNRDPNTGFDSLLDTMTNAVGILIVVLAVTYLVIIDNVDRVANLDLKPSLVKNEDYDQLQAELKRLDGVLEQLKEKWKAAERDVQYHQAHLDQVQTSSDTLTNILKQFDSSHFDIQEVEQKLQRDRNMPRQLEDEIDHLKEQMKNFQHAVNLQRELPKPKVTIARVPDPVPAPKGAERITFLCRYGQVVYYRTDEMTQLLHQGIADATGAELSDPKITIRYFDKAVEYFDTHEVALKGLRWRLRVVQRVDETNVIHRDLKAFLEWTVADIGETYQDIQKDNSQYRKILSGFADKDVYAKYYVWGDSFPEYVVAREIVDEHNIPAGWVAKEGDAEYIIVLSSTQTGKKGHEAPDKLQQKVRVPRFYTGGGAGIGGGGSVSHTPGTGGGSVGIIGASPGGDFVD